MFLSFNGSKILLMKMINHDKYHKTVKINATSDKLITVVLY